MDELIGFITTLVKHNDSKIILFAYEDKIKDDISKELKEKVLVLQMNLNLILKKIDAIINSRYRPSFKNIPKTNLKG